MKKLVLYSIVSLMAVAMFFAAVSADDKQVTIKGEVVDQPCYEGKGAAGRGEGHRGCAIGCAKRGGQLAIVEDGSNTVYSITGDYAANKNEKMIPFVAEMVQAKGTVMEKDGKKYINITSIEKVAK